MKPAYLLLMVTATLAAQNPNQMRLLRWLDAQYDIARRGFSAALIRTGSPSRRGIDFTKHPTTRDANFNETTTEDSRPKSSASLRALSKYFNAKFQDPVPESTQFPCDTEPGAPGTRSATRPTSVHQLRPGDIDVVGAMGDSLTAASGSAAANMIEVAIENRGMSWSAGGESTWREYITLPNILKEFNPSLVGYSLNDSLGSQKSSQFNVAEPLGMSRDMPFQAKLLERRMRTDKRVNYEQDWKLVTIMIGSNDFCSEMCYYKNYSVTPELHRDDILRALDYLRDNMPRTLVNLVPPPQLRVIQEFRGRSTPCFLINEFECSCLFGTRWQHMKAKFTELMQLFQLVDMEVTQESRYATKEDFAVVGQPFLMNAIIPKKKLPNGDIVTDFSFLSEDCFHFSQKTQAMAANSLWNNMLEPVGNKTRYNVGLPFEKFLCPTEESPYIYTNKNSLT